MIADLLTGAAGMLLLILVMFGATHASEIRQFPSGNFGLPHSGPANRERILRGGKRN